MTIALAIVTIYGILLCDPHHVYADSGIEAVCKPNYDAVLSFPVSGTISQIYVEVGQRVKKGDVLAKLNDTAERKRLAQLKAESENYMKIKAAEAQLAQKKVDFKRISDCSKRGAATSMEVEHARLDVVIEELSLELAKFERQQAQREYEEMRHQIERMAIVAPCDGIVERRLVEVGETVDTATQVLQLVNTNPLWIDVPTPLAIANKTSIGSPTTIRFTTNDKGLAGKVTHVASVADSASETRLVRVEVDNKELLPAGTRVWVSFNRINTKATKSSKDKVAAKTK